MKSRLSILVFSLLAAPLAFSAEERRPMPIDALWDSAVFRRAFTASYGIDSRIEPKVSSDEKTVLDAVAEEMEDGDRDGAIGKLIGQSGLNDSAALIFALGNLRFEEGKIEDALTNFERAIELYPNFRDAHRNLAVALVQQSQYDKAEPHLIRALELGARDGLTLGLLGYCHSNAGRHQAALQAYRLAQLTMPNETQWKMGEAHALLDMEDPRASASIYTGLLDDRPNDESLWINQGDAFLQLGEPEKGIANLEFTRRLGRLGAAETISLGHLYLNEAMIDAALVSYREAINSEAPAPLAKVVDAVENLTRLRYWTDAADVAALVKAAPLYAKALGLEVEVEAPVETEPAEAAATGEPDETSDVEAPQVPEVKPDPKAASRLVRCEALIELRIGDPERGAALVQGLIDADPLDSEALRLMAKFHAEAERFEEAEMLLEQAARDPEVEAEALRELGEMLVDQERFEEALKPLRQALNLQPDENLAAYLEAVERAAER